LPRLNRITMSKELTTSYIPLPSGDLSNKGKMYYRLNLTIKPRSKTQHLILTDMTLPFVSYSFFSESKARIVESAVYGRTIKFLIKNSSEEYADAHIYLCVRDMTLLKKIKNLSSNAKTDRIPLDDSVSVKVAVNAAESTPKEEYIGNPMDE